MKNYVLALLILCCLSGFSQRTESRITHEKLRAATNLREVISGIPNDCKVYSFVITLSFNGSVRELTETQNLKGEFTKDGDFSEALKEILSKTEKGKSFFIEKVSATCPAFFKSKSYKITVD